MPSPKRRGLIERFRDDPDCRIFLSTDAGSTGLNLQASSLLINIDLPWNPAVLEQRIARIYRLGQNNPVQIINMIARDTIEERMLSTLSFKSNLAAGILDNGDDSVFLEQSKFDRIVETIDGVVNGPAELPEPPQPAAAPTEEEAPAEEAKPEPVKEEAPVKEQTTPKAENAPADTSEPAPHPTLKSETAAAAKISEAKGNQSDRQPATEKEVRDTVASGIAALGKIAGMLRDPESTRALADALVKEDPATGQTTLNIPVPDKSTVVNLLSAFATLLNR